jgi:penicillin amidase
MLAQALGETTARLARLYGDDPGAWRWGRAHETVFANQALGPIPVLGALTTARVASNGDGNTVGRAEFAAGSFDAVHGAAYRGVYDLADLDASLFVVAPGQSGNPVSRHSRDFIARWNAGRTVTLGQAPASVTATVSLRPAAR